MVVLGSVIVAVLAPVMMVSTLLFLIAGTAPIASMSGIPEPNAILKMKK